MAEMRKKNGEDQWRGLDFSFTGATARGLAEELGEEAFCDFQDTFPMLLTFFPPPTLQYQEQLLNKLQLVYIKHTKFSILENLYLPKCTTLCMALNNMQKDPELLEP